MIELKPCPFCGNTELKTTVRKYPNDMATEDMSPGNPIGYAIKTKCHCGLEFETHYTIENDIDVALKYDVMTTHIEKWNTRFIEKDMIQ